MRTTYQSPQYPRCAELFLPIRRPAGAIPYVPHRLLTLALEARGPAFAERYAELTCGDTQSGDGPYAYDVEMALERMLGKPRTGSQLVWD